MTYRGKVKNGVVVLEGSPPLGEGTLVRVELLDSVSSESGTTVYGRLAELAGKAKGLPCDLARCHDHYLHGRERC